MYRGWYAKPAVSQAPFYAAPGRALQAHAGINAEVGTHRLRASWVWGFGARKTEHAVWNRDYDSSVRMTACFRRS